MRGASDQSDAGDRREGTFHKGRLASISQTLSIFHVRSHYGNIKKRKGTQHRSAMIQTNNEGRGFFCAIQDVAP
jgi:hypothetical protein